ncbi:MAG: DUF2505 domain-containing protein [Deltaproteobacteria bacterium]
MSKYTLTHEIQCDAETFWKIFLDKDFNEKLFREHLGFPKFDIVEFRETDGSVFRKVAAMPKMEMPGAVAKLLGSSFSYTEEGSMDRKVGVWKWKMTPSAMPDKIHNEGTVRIEPAGAGKVRRIAEITSEVKIFGVGGLIESTTEKNMRAGWDASAAFMNKWIASGKAA